MSSEKLKSDPKVEIQDEAASPNVLFFAEGTPGPVSYFPDGGPMSEWLPVEDEREKTEYKEE